VERSSWSPNRPGSFLRFSPTAPCRLCRSLNTTARARVCFPHPPGLLQSISQARGPVRGRRCAAVRYCPGQSSERQYASEQECLTVLSVSGDCCANCRRLNVRDAEQQSQGPRGFRPAPGICGRGSASFPEIFVAIPQAHRVGRPSRYRLDLNERSVASRIVGRRLSWLLRCPARPGIS